jgi:hypothetical protein
MRTISDLVLSRRSPSQAVHARPLGGSLDITNSSSFVAVSRALSSVEDDRISVANSIAPWAQCREKYAAASLGNSLRDNSKKAVKAASAGIGSSLCLIRSKKMIQGGVESVWLASVYRADDRVIELPNLDRPPRIVRWAIGCHQRNPITPVPTFTSLSVCYNCEGAQVRTAISRAYEAVAGEKFLPNLVSS